MKNAMTAAEIAGLTDARRAYPTMPARRLARLIANNPDSSIGAPTILCTFNDIHNELRRLDGVQFAAAIASV